MKKTLLAPILGILPLLADPIQVSGIYPGLAMFNDEGECGTGAVVPWADRLWVITYAPHSPKGSSDKLYEITPDLRQIIREESIGGTPANRMIHPESKQLFIGPYAISEDRNVRSVPYGEMFGRHTGNARHLTNPAGKIVYATMEEGIYEVDVKTLAVTELWAEEAKGGEGRRADLHGYHGKGFYSGQGVYAYSNNGMKSNAARHDPLTPSGVLAEWDGKSEAWKTIRENQFTEVTGPGGISGNANPAKDPIWAVGWDAKSLLLGVRMPETGWSFYRLPKGSHSYDGAHGWHTEWPRIREIGEDDFLMTMHGTMWKFPKNFTPATSSGIVPRSNHLKVIGDFAEWNGHVVFGCDDTAKNEFLNKRRSKAEIAAPQSQSNLWFVKHDEIDRLGPAIGRGSVWLGEDMDAGAPSDPYMFSGYFHRALWLSHASPEKVEVRIEVDRAGDGKWELLRAIMVAPGDATLIEFRAEEQGAWIRLNPLSALRKATAAFIYRERDDRQAVPDPIFSGLAKPLQPLTGGPMRARDMGVKTLSFAATDSSGNDLGYYELDADLKLVRIDDGELLAYTKKHTPFVGNVFTVDDASVIHTDEDGRRWRLPKGDPGLDSHPLGASRVAREIATERDLFNAHGTFYELPARNAGGFAKLRPISTHNLAIHDFASYRGLLIMNGVSTEPPVENKHIIRSDEGKTALWVGAIDDLWKAGKPRGKGGPWKDTPVKAGEPSDPYLMTGYDKKSLALSSADAVIINVEIDPTGYGDWVGWKSFATTPDAPVSETFPEAFSAYWIRFTSDTDTTATALLDYE